MSIDLNKLKGTNIRKCQYEAIEMLDSYLKSEENVPALVKMPTGTGKTGVMALAAQLNEEAVLILVPNATLPEQTEMEIHTVFWNKINFHIPNIKSCRIIRESKDMNSYDWAGAPVLIMTVQLLLAISKDNELFENLKTHVKLIIFDEGHREPARYWSIVVDEFVCKKIYFTATPYRNDKMIFEVNQNYVYQYHTNNAIENRDILCPEFDCITNEITSDDNQLVEWIHRLKQKTKNKILIRVNDSARINKLVTLLNQNNVCAVGFHSALEKGDNLYREGRDVYKVKDNYQIFFHDEMFIEGVDIAELEILVLVNPFQNAKNFIQQVGRILRLGQCIKTPKVYLPETELLVWKEQWNLYCEYDSEQGTGKVTIDYIGAMFKKEWDVFTNKIEPDEIRIPKRASIYRSKESCYEVMKTKLEERVIRRKDLEQWPIFENNNFWIVFYEKETPTNYLKDFFYYNKSLEFTCIYEVKGDSEFYLFYSDSAGMAIPNMKKELTQLPEKNYHKLLENEADIRNIKTRTTLARNVGINSRDMRGFGLGEMPQSMTDRLSYLTSVTAVSDKWKRYISPKSSRVSDDEYDTYIGYIEWCKNLVQIMESDVDPNKYFDRYSYTVEPIQDIPSFVCLYLNTSVKNCETDDVAELDAIYGKIDSVTKKFFVDFFGNVCECELEGIGTEYIRVKSDDLNNYVVLKNGKDLLGYINKGNFTLFYNSKQIAYTDGKYYLTNVRTRYNPASSWDVWDDIIVVPKLADCDDEKTAGVDPLDDCKWPDKSVFCGVMEEIKLNHSGIDYLLCADLGTEVADFIGISTTESRLYFIHCKHGKSKLSASAFQDVYGQASKNSHYLFMTDTSLLEYLKNKFVDWQCDWKIEKKEDGITKIIKKKRLVVTPSGKVFSDFENELKKLLSNEEGTTKREVWIVTSGLSKSELEKELKKGIGKSQKEEVHQLMWFTQNMRDTFSTYNVQMKIFCKE